MKISKILGKRDIAQAKKIRLKIHLERAGLDIDLQKIFTKVFNAAIIINLLLSAYLLYFFAASFGTRLYGVIMSFILLWLFLFPLMVFAFWLVFFVYIDIKIYKRKTEIEDVLPDFLQLASSNISAGMSIDRALWFAVRPRFGVLAKEIETVAKETMSGLDLRIALEKMCERYDSIVLRRSISMLNEGIAAGGEIGDLLNKIASNIQDQKSMIKDMAANVTTYIIFITFSAIVAAPFLFALSGVFISVMSAVGASVAATGSSGASTGMNFSFGGVGISLSDFKIFSVISLSLTSVFSAIMVSTIKKGNAKSGLKFIPIFMAISLSLYFLSQGFTTKFMQFFFTF